MSARRPLQIGQIGQLGRGPGSHVLILLAFFGVVYALVSRFALRAFPFSGDEYSSLLQARIFARGVLRVPAPAHADLLQVDHVVMDAWVRSKYPPGTSALLALGVRAGAAWLVTPLEAVIALALTWYAARAVLEHRAALAVAVMLGAAPLFAFQAATFYSHTGAVMFLAGALAALAWWTVDHRPVRLVAFGAAIGCAFLTRPFDAVLFGAAVLSLRSWRAIILPALGAAPFLALNLAYQAAQFGSPFMDGYRAYGATYHPLFDEHPVVAQLGLRPAFDVMELWNHADIVRALAVDWTVPGTVLLAIFGWVHLGKDPRALALRRFLVTVICLFCLALLISVAGKDDGARPRYLSTALLPLTFLAGAGAVVAFEGLRVTIGRRLGVAVAALVVLVLPSLQIAWVLDERLPALTHRMDLYDAVAALGVPDAVVIVRVPYPTRMTRNGLFDESVLYVGIAPERPAADVARAFPGRPLFEARERVNEHNSAVWEVTPVL
jgi:hypothetical protein